VLQAIAGHADFNEEQDRHGDHLLFTLFILLTVWLLRRGSPESKPVGAPHDATGIEG
jgi:hypothetical protein